MPERAERWLALVTGDFVSSPWFDRLARFGYASKGAVFGIVGVLAIARGLGGSALAEDTPGALESVRELPFHEVLLGLLALGLAGYALWRMVQGLLDSEDEGTGWLGLSKRAVYLGIGGFYGYLAVWAVAVILGARNDDNGIQDFTATVLGWPGGQVLVGIAGLGVIVGGLNEILFAIRGAYRAEFEKRHMAAWERVAMKAAGWWGHVGRGAVYGLIGYLVIKSAVTFDPDEAAGLADAFQALEEQPYGWALLLLAGAAFLAFGLYCALLAVHREIDGEAAVHGSLEGGRG
jgi:uncharacterized membrane protein